MKTPNINKNFSKGGLLGAIIGLLFSTQIQKKEDNTLKKGAKSALFSGIGFVLGNLIENFFKKHK
jgi:hypothetical protein